LLFLPLIDIQILFKFKYAKILGEKEYNNWVKKLLVSDVATDRLIAAQCYSQCSSGYNDYKDVHERFQILSNVIFDKDFNVVTVAVNVMYHLCIYANVNDRKKNKQLLSIFDESIFTRILKFASSYDLKKLCSATSFKALVGSLPLTSSPQSIEIRNLYKKIS